MKPKENEFYANTQLQPLAEHLFAVGYLAQAIFKNSVDNADYVNHENTAFLSGVMHDPGKVDPKYQNWVKKGKQKDPSEDGQHIDVKFTFEKHPRHNEISLMLFNIFEKQSSNLNNAQKIALQHVTYWHHAKPYRKDDKFKGVFTAYEYLSKNITSSEFENLLSNALKLLKHVSKISRNYNQNDIIGTSFTWSMTSTQELLDDFSYTFKNTNFPEFKNYNLSDDFPGIQDKIITNAQHNILRACVISADRLISQLSAAELNERIQKNRLDELLDNQELTSNLTSHIENALSSFPDSERTQKQAEVAQQLADLRDIAVLSGAAGCGKTKIALEWAKLKQAQKIIWVCPRVQVCQGIFEELTQQYLPEADIEIFTSEFKYTNNWDNPTKENNYFSGDVVVTTIDQILGSITTHTNVNALIPFIDAHVVFDEYHEYINMDIFNLLFAELVANKNMRQNYEKRVLLVSATPHYGYLENILGLDIDEDVIEMPSFNQSQYQIKFIDYPEDDYSISPFYQSYQNKTFVISNTAKTAQIGFLTQNSHENSILFHSKFIRSDKKYWFNEVYESFKKDGTNKYNVLRSGPIVQASLNISCNTMLSEMSSPENILQRLGRLDRFGENEGVNILSIAITEDTKRGKQTGPSAKFLAKLHSLQSAKAWYNYLENNLAGKVFELPEIYQLYKDFYHSSYKNNELKQDLESAIKSSITILGKKVTEPVKIIKSKFKEKKTRISKNSLRGDSRFVQLAKLDINDYTNPIFLNEYAYTSPTSDKEDFDNLTESLFLIQNIGLIEFIAKKHGNIDPTHPMRGIKERQMTLRYKVLENYSRDADYPLYLSYTEDDLNKVGGASVRNNQAIYYGVCDKQPIGSVSIQLINELNNIN